MQKQLQHQDKVPSHPNNTWNLTNRGAFTRKMVQNRTPPSVRLHVFLGERVLQKGYATSTQSPTSAPWQPRHSTKGPIYTRTSTSPAATTLWMDESISHRNHWLLVFTGESSHSRFSEIGGAKWNSSKSTEAAHATANSRQPWHAMCPGNPGMGPLGPLPSMIPPIESSSKPIGIKMVYPKPCKWRRRRRHPLMTRGLSRTFHPNRC